MAGGPPYTQLDMPQVIKQVYDTSENRLRVDAGTINMSGDLQVSIDAASDSVKIGDGTGNFLAVNSDGSINVNGGGGGGGNPAAGPTGSAVPADASYTGFNSGGNLVGISTANPLPVVQQGSVAVTGTFFQATQPVSATSLPLPTGAATSALQTTINTTLGTPFQAGGSIANTAFGISGTLPAYASTPTFNLGTLNGAATNY